MLEVSAYLEGEQGEGERDRLSKRNYIYSLPVINLIILGLFFQTCGGLEAFLLGVYNLVSYCIYVLSVCVRLSLSHYFIP